MISNYFIDVSKMHQKRTANCEQSSLSRKDHSLCLYEWDRRDGEVKSESQSTKLIMITETFSALPSDTACSLCGADVQSPDFRANEHGENLCGRGTISCSLCSKTFALWSHYETHKKCHQKSKQRQYPCQTCSKVLNLSIEIVSS